MKNYFLIVFNHVNATLQPILSIHPSVGCLVSRSRRTLFYDLISLTTLQLPKWSSDLKYGPCLPAYNVGSHVAGRILR